MVRFVDDGNVDSMVIGDHMVLELPAGAPGKFGDDSITISEEVNIKVDVMNRLVLCKRKLHFHVTSTLTSLEM